MKTKRTFIRKPSSRTGENAPFLTPGSSWKSPPMGNYDPDPPSSGPDTAEVIRDAVNRMSSSSMESATLPSNLEVVERSSTFLSELAASMKEPMDAAREFFLTEALPITAAIRLGTADAIEITTLSTEEPPNSSVYESTLDQLVKEALVLKQAVFVADTMRLSSEARLLFLSRFLPERVDPTMVEQLKSVLANSAPPTHFNERGAANQPKTIKRRPKNAPGSQ